MAAPPLLLLTPIDHCKTYPFMCIFINFIYIAIYCHGTSLKKPIWP